MLKTPYHDQTYHNPDGTWWMLYSPKAGGMNIAANASLIRCMTDSEPLLVVKQVSDKSSSTGARHRLLGLGLVEQFHPARQLFRIRGVAADRFTDYLNRPLADGLVETALRGTDDPRNGLVLPKIRSTGPKTRAFSLSRTNEAEYGLARPEQGCP